MTDPLGLPPRQNTEIYEDFYLDYPFKHDFVYVKNESAVTKYDSSVCKVDILRFKESLACAGFSICVEQRDDESLCADNVLPQKVSKELVVVVMLAKFKNIAMDLLERRMMILLLSPTFGQSLSQDRCVC